MCRQVLNLSVASQQLSDTSQIPRSEVGHNLEHGIY